MNDCELKELLKYDCETGDFTWKKRLGGRMRIGAVAGTQNGNGYTQIMINRQVYRAHRLAWLYMTGKWPENDIDHINHDRTDNRWVNLREVTRTENLKNSSLRKRNTSGVCGVHWYEGRDKWQSYIAASGKRVHLGYFTDKFEAICARKSADNRYGYHENHGE